MARYRWTLALILICLPILTTVITAFRIRDLPKSTNEINKPELKTRKCDDCDVNEPKVGYKLHNVKIESEKKYEEVKKVVREKPQIINQKIIEGKSALKFKDKTAINDDDSVEVELLNKKTSSKGQPTLKIEQTSEFKTNILESKKPTVKTDNDNDDDDDDDNDDDGSKEDSKENNRKISNVKYDSKQNLKENEVKKPILKLRDINKNSDDDDDDSDGDDDDDDDDDDEDDGIKISITKKIVTKEKKTKDLKEKIKEDNQTKGSKSKITTTEDEKKQKEKLGPIKNENKLSEVKEKISDKTLSQKTDQKEVQKEKKHEIKPVDEKPERDTAKQQKETSKDSTQLKPPQEKKTSKKEEKENLKKEVKKSNLESKKDDKPKETSKSKETKKSTKTESVTKKQQESSHKKSIESTHERKEVHSKSESNLKQVTDALKRRNLLQSEFEDFYSFFPTFAPNFSRIHNPECRRQGQILLRQLRGTKLWALNMLDATAKIPSGLLQGNGIQLGDFDQCLGSRARVQLETGSIVKVQGQYCLARLDLKAERSDLELPVHLAQAKNLFKSRIDDPGHFVPRFSTLSWGICLPSACNPQDVEVVVKDALMHYQHISGLVIRVKVDSRDCQTTSGNDWWEDWMQLPTLLTLAFYAVVILLVLVATVQDYLASRQSEEVENTEDSTEMKETKDDEKEKDAEASKRPDGFVSAFSLYRTIEKLVAPGSTDEISCIHGIRGLATLALLLAHKFLPVAVMPYTNRVKIAETVSSPLWSWCRAGWMYTDCFLLLSGVLMAHRFTSAGAPRRLLSRYLRLSPALLAVVLFYAYIWDNISEGPMWGTLVTKNAEVCQQGWWWNLLYVQNYFGFEDMCAPQTHQLALDMQLTILGVIVVWGIQSREGLSKILLPVVHLLAAYSRYTTVRDHRLTMLAYHGASVSQLYRTARLSYTSTFHRSTPYLIGLSLGLALKKTSAHGKFLLTLGWLFSITLWGLVLWAGMDSGYPQYRYNVTFAAQYAALAPIASALAIAWIIYVVHSGNCDFLVGFLCCRPLVLISRLSYALYLCQFIVFLTNAATVRTSSEFTLISVIDIQEISGIILSSVILTLTFVTPMQSMQKISFWSESKNDQSESSDKLEPIVEEPEEKYKEEISEIKCEEKIELPIIRSRQHLVAHREMLEEIPEVEVEYEIQREKIEALEEIIEEEEDEVGEEIDNNDDEDLEIIEEEQAGEEMWEERDYSVGRSQSRNDDQDLDEWEWTTNGGDRNGAQYYRYSR
ncbi:uncharacterized protein LOC113523318 [Galleria mellonella]|uniref:Uncharacterized protein LOC113523318 n=1 Tax=Galleria mellonella TaxID=7137 RepID=A0ABM3MJL4_GALME|nr:uncharacterized protein LOC113523318 [Galleria mellonella]